MFNQVRQHLVEQGRGRVGSIQGELFPPPVLNAIASQVLTYTFYLGLFMVVLGEWFFTTVFPQATALELVKKLKSNQILTMIVLMGINMAANSLLSTGAFEVYYNGSLVFSKLDTGVVPDPNYLLDRFQHFDSAAELGVN